MAPTKRVERSTKQVTCTSQDPKPEETCQESCEGGPEVMDVLLDTSSWLKATETHIARQWESESACILHERDYSANQF